MKNPTLNIVVSIIKGLQKEKTEYRLAYLYIAYIHCIFTEVYFSQYARAAASQD